jgi:hypothetical protein
MAGLVPAIHDFGLGTAVKSWMPGTSAGHDDEMQPAENRRILERHLEKGWG